MSEYRRKEYVQKHRPGCWLEDVSLNGTWHEVLVYGAAGEEKVVGCGRTAMDAWNDAATSVGDSQ